MVCSQCKKQIDNNDVEFCPECGGLVVLGLKEPEKNNNKRLIFGIVAAVLVIIVVIIVAVTSNASGNSWERTAILKGNVSVQAPPDWEWASHTSLSTFTFNGGSAKIEIFNAGISGTIEEKLNEAATKYDNPVEIESMNFNDLECLYFEFHEDGMSGYEFVLLNDKDKVVIGLFSFNEDEILSSSAKMDDFFKVIKSIKVF